MPSSGRKGTAYAFSLSSSPQCDWLTQQQQRSYH